MASFGERAKQYEKAIAASEKELARLTEVRDKARTDLDNAQKVHREAVKAVGVYQQLAKDATADYQAAEESVSRHLGQLNRLKSDLAVVHGQQTGGVPAMAGR
jgi:chromosome segregation ATPase